MELTIHWVTVSNLDAQPSHINIYDNMRQHLVECLEAKKMFPFPSTYQEKSHRFVNEETIDIYCHCRGQESALMIQCSEWHHMECEQSIPQRAVKSNVLQK